jgi:hypothetical protein
MSAGLPHGSQELEVSHYGGLGLEDVDIRGMGCSSETDVTTLYIVGFREDENESFTGCKKPRIMETFRNTLL